MPLHSAGKARLPTGSYEVVDTPNPPLRMFLGEAPLGIATADYESRLAAWREWQPVAASAQNYGN